MIKNLDEIWSKINHWDYSEIVNFYENVRKNGLNTRLLLMEKNYLTLQKNYKKSNDGLVRRNIKTDKGNESTFLEPLKKILESGKSPAEMWKKLFFSEWNNDIDMLYETNYFKVLENEKV